MKRNNSRADDLEKVEQEKRGLRIKNIRENELYMNKTDFAKRTRNIKSVFRLSRKW